MPPDLRLRQNPVLDGVPELVFPGPDIFDRAFDAE